MNSSGMRCAYCTCFVPAPAPEACPRWPAWRMRAVAPGEWRALCPPRPAPGHRASPGARSAGPVTVCVRPTEGTRWGAQWKPAALPAWWALGLFHVVWGAFWFCFYTVPSPPGITRHVLLGVVQRTHITQKFTPVSAGQFSNAVYSPVHSLCKI